MASQSVNTVKVPYVLKRDFASSSSQYNWDTRSDANAGGATAAGISSGATDGYANRGAGSNSYSASESVGRNAATYANYTFRSGSGSFRADGITTGKYTYVFSQIGTKKTISTSTYTNTSSTSGSNSQSFSASFSTVIPIEQTQREVKFNPPPAKVGVTYSTPTITGTTVGTIPESQQRGIVICSTGSVTTTQTQTGATTSRTTTTSKFSRSFTTPTEQDFPVLDTAGQGNLTYKGYTQPTWDIGDGTTNTVSPYVVREETRIIAEPDEYIVAAKGSPPLGWQPMSACFNTGLNTNIVSTYTTAEATHVTPCKPSETSFSGTQATAGIVITYGPPTFRYTRYWDGTRNSSVYSETNNYTYSASYYPPIVENFTQLAFNPEIVTRTIDIPEYVSDGFVGRVSTTIRTSQYASAYTYTVPVGSPPWSVCNYATLITSSSSTSRQPDEEPSPNYNATGTGESAGAYGAGFSRGETNYPQRIGRLGVLDPFGVRAGMTLHEQVYPNGYIGFGHATGTPTKFYLRYSVDGFEGEDLSGHAFLNAVKRVGKFAPSNNSSSYEGIQTGVAGAKLIVTDTKNFCIWPAPTSVRTAQPVIKSDVIGFASDGLQTSTEVAFTSATYKTKTELGGGTTTSEKVTWSFNATYKVDGNIPNTKDFRSIYSPADVLGDYVNDLEFTGPNGFGYVGRGTFGGDNANIVTDGTMAFDAGDYSVRRYKGNALVGEGNTVYTNYQTRVFPQGERWIVSYRALVWGDDNAGNANVGRVQVKRIDSPVPDIPY